MAQVMRVAVSSRALFNLEDGNAIYEKEGVQAFDRYMRENEKKPLRQGVAFSLIKKLLGLNLPSEAPKVEVVLLSSNTLDAGARVINSVQHYGLNIERGFFTSGADRFKLAKAIEVTVFLSTNQAEVRKALDLGIAAANLMPNSRMADEASDKICVAFDGDSVIFDDSSEIVNQTSGLDAFMLHEKLQADVPLPAGPFKPVLQALHDIQKGYANPRECPLRIALVTARGTSAYARPLHTFRQWGITVDEALFCNGMAKGPLLNAIGADLFFDDGPHNIASAVEFVPSGHVPKGVLGGTGIGATHSQPSAVQ